MEKRTKITERHQLITGTEWPFIHTLEYHQGCQEWIVTEDICNGVPFKATIYKNEDEAIAHFECLSGRE